MSVQNTININRAIEINIADRLEHRPGEDAWDGSEPDFYRIALELDYLEALELRGWWGAFSNCMYCEQVLRNFGPLVSAAATHETSGEHADGLVVTLNILDAIWWHLDWQMFVAQRDDKAQRYMRFIQHLIAELRRHLKAQQGSEAVAAE
ncbi:hypothetical protein [Tabrizicola thermarum]|uniref:hypothetical protein n=1 Tax=Tabrizicola thermarum TaxID=2670345 RepID=UPI000FFC08BC|nr:hypothetical protein [Tabrizicola thermarum]